MYFTRLLEQSPTLERTRDLQLDDRGMWRPNPPPVYCYPQGPQSYPGPSGLNFPVPLPPGQTIHLTPVLGAWPGPMFSTPPPIPPMPAPARLPPQGLPDQRLAFAPPPQAFPTQRASTAGAIPREPYQAHGAASAQGRGNHGYRFDPSGPGNPRGGSGGRGRPDGRRYNQTQNSFHHSQVSKFVFMS